MSEVKIIHFSRDIRDEYVLIKGIYMRFEMSQYSTTSHNREEYGFTHTIENKDGDVYLSWSFDEKMSERKRRKMQKMIIEEVFKNSPWRWEYFLEHIPTENQEWLKEYLKKG